MATTDTIDPLKTELNKGLMATTQIGASIPKSASVAENVAKITSQDSPLMQQAKTQGLQAANKRGLLNSSMAIGSAQDAVIRAATPIASQDANTASNQYLASQDRTLSQVQQQEEIAAQKQMQEKQLSEAEKQQIRDIGFRQGEGAADRALEETIQNKSFALQEQIAKWNLDSNDRNAAAQLVTNMSLAYGDRYAAVMSNTALSASQRSAQLTSLKNLRDRELDFVQQLYDVELQW